MVNNLNQYVSIGGTTIKYDLDGNVVERRTAEATSLFEFDQLGNLAQSSEPGVTQRFGYDVFGNLRSTLRNGILVSYLNDPVGLGNMVAEYGPDGMGQVRAIHGLGLIETESFEGATQTFYAFDGYGSTAEVTSATGVVERRYAYSPFGAVLVGSDGVSDGPYLFGAAYGARSLGNGAVRMRSRVLDTNAGSFISQDSRRLGGGDVNLYRFVLASPVNLFDPTGTSPLGLVGLVIGGVSNTLSYAYLNAATPADITPGGLAGAFVSGALQGLWYGESFGRGGFAADSVIGGLSNSAGYYVRAAIDGRESGSLGADALNGAIVFPIVAKPGSLFFSKSAIVHLTGNTASGRSLKGVLPKANFAQGLSGKAIEAASGIVAPHAPRGEDNRSRDPNGIVGPDGIGVERWISGSERLVYTIQFENDAVLASAPAQIVRLLQTLDANRDARTFRLDFVSVGSVQFFVPFKGAYFATRLDLREAYGIFVDVAAGVDTAAGIVFWEFSSVDPNTGNVPSDSGVGFLPPNLVPPEGKGSATYSVLPKRAAMNGARLDAKATILFDDNAPIDTPAI
ncbi:MAG: RHS repeat domain-containing protein [Planctomycetales bacterium]